jgi:N-acyl-D-aspartate/D-glutamate deacylase
MTQQERNRELEGKSIEPQAQEQGKGKMDAFMDLSMDENLQTYFICLNRNTNVTAKRQLLGSPSTVIGTTDGRTRPHTIDHYEYSIHLLSYSVRDQ